MQPLIWHEKKSPVSLAPQVPPAGMQHSSWSFEKVIQDYCASTCLRCACDRIGHAFVCVISDGLSWGYLKSWIQHDRMMRRKTNAHTITAHTNCIQLLIFCWLLLSVRKKWSIFDPHRGSAQHPMDRDSRPRTVSSPTVAANFCCLEDIHPTPNVLGHADGKIQCHVTLKFETKGQPCRVGGWGGVTSMMGICHLRWGALMIIWCLWWWWWGGWWWWWRRRWDSSRHCMRVRP